MLYSISWIEYLWPFILLQCILISLSNLIILKHSMSYWRSIDLLLIRLYLYILLLIVDHGLSILHLLGLVLLLWLFLIVHLIVLDHVVSLV